MSQLLFFASTIFLLVVIYFIFYRKNYHKIAIISCSVIIIWLVFQAVIANNGYYKNHLQSLPPKIVLFGIFPMLFGCVVLLLTKKSRNFLFQIPVNFLLVIHIVRIPVELGLYYLSIKKLIPVLMTFEGQNWDILSGILAIVVLFFYLKNKIDNILLLIWNIAGLALLINIVLLAFFSAPTPLQKYAFDQPNIAILQFPYVWLPTFIVPMVLLSHIVLFFKLLSKKHAKTL